MDAVADVRRHPGSRRHPHVAREAMERWLGDAGIGYRWFEALGGRRAPVAGSRNRAVRNEQFRGYADHMASSEFAASLAELQAYAGERSIAVMCAESVWWRCHRRLLADHLVLVEGVAVEHLFHDGRAAPHEPTSGARVDGRVVVYEATAQGALFDDGGGAPPA